MVEELTLHHLGSHSQQHRQELEGTDSRHALEKVPVGLEIAGQSVGGCGI